MDLMYKFLGLPAAFCLFQLLSYSPRYLEGTVVKEAGSATQLVDSPGLFNKSVKIGKPDYVVTIENASTPERYILRVNDDSYKPLSALAEAIEPGSRVRIRTSDDRWSVGSDNVGSVGSSLVEILGR